MLGQNVPIYTQYLFASFFNMGEHSKMAFYTYGLWYSPLYYLRALHSCCMYRLGSLDINTHQASLLKNKKAAAVQSLN